MKAISYYAYGSPEVLRLQETGIPAVNDEDVLVRVRAASVNPLDWHFMRGTSYLVRAHAGCGGPGPAGWVPTWPAAATGRYRSTGAFSPRRGFWWEWEDRTRAAGSRL